MRKTIQALAAISALSFVGAVSAFEISSQDFAPGGRLAKAQVYQGFGCQGGNRSPQLRWRDPPAGTRSFAVTAYDPDAPTGSGWWHWVVWDIPSTVSELPGGGPLPAGVREGRTDFGTPGFGGACPPVGDKPHRYIFKVFALKVDKLELPENPTAALVGFVLHANTLGHAEITATYSREK